MRTKLPFSIVMETLPLPAYSERTVALARAYDRAALACVAAGWHLNDLCDSNPESVELDDLAGYAKRRVDLLRDSLTGMRDVLNAAICEESRPTFEVHIDRFGHLILPDAVYQALGPYMDFPMMIPWKAVNRDADRDETIGVLKQDWHLIRFDEALFKLPRHYPGSFVEIWWRRWFYNSFHCQGRLYEMCLVPNPEYGWDCIGHER